MRLNLEIISPQKIVYNEEVDLVIFPGIEGDFGILKNHMPFLTNLRISIIYIYIDNKLVQSYLVNGGVLEVSKNRCSLLTEDIINTKEYKLENKDDKIEQLKDKIVRKPHYS